MQPILYTKQTADENIGEVFVKIIQKSIERVWSPEVKPVIMTEETKLTLTTQQNVGFVKILSRVRNEFATTVTLLESFGVLLIKNVTRCAENPNSSQFFPQFEL